MPYLRLAFIISLVASAAIAQPAAQPDTLAAGPALPVLAWGGIPADQGTPARYRELADAGFTHMFSGAGDADAMRKMLDAGHAEGVKHLISIPQLESDPEGTARLFKDHPGMGGYYLRDEPGASLFPKLGEWARRVRSVDAVNPCYVNLFPTYGVPQQWETPDYPTYVERFLAEVPTPMLSFDHYPVVREGADPASDRLRPDFYYNLEVCSAAARKAGRPLWAFALSVAHAPYPVPEVAHLRVQAFSDLAYGTQVMQYFTYWTFKSDTWNFHEAPIDADGKRTPTYDRVKRVNAEIQALRGAFVGSTVVAVGHTGAALPNGTARYAPAAPVKSLDTGDGGGAGVVVSLLSNGGRRFLVVVNRDLHKPMPLDVTFDGTKPVRRAARDGTLHRVAGDAHASQVEPGDVVVFAWDEG
jgi:hypothetical protein